MSTANNIAESEDNLTELRALETQRKLIDLVERRTGIWDPRSKNHVNRIVRDIYWKEIGEAIGLTGKEARRMWRRMREEFKKQLDKEKASAEDSSSSESFESTWPFFERLQFLKDSLSHKRQKTEHVPPLVSISDGSEADERLPRNEPSKSPAPDVPETSPAKESKTETNNSEWTRTKLFIRYNVDDDDECFFNSLLPHVKSLPLNKQFEFRVETQKLLYDLTFNKNISGWQEDAQGPAVTDRIDNNTNSY